MKTLNSVIIEGNMVREPVFKITPNGTAMCNFSIAANRSYKKGDEFMQETSYFDVETWAHLAKLCEQNGAKGRCVRVVGKLKHKDLIGVPWRVAFALQDDGWYLRQDIIWNKPNVMPEAVKDRCTKSHEYIFLLSKNKKYYFDNEAIKEEACTFENRPHGIVRNRIYEYDSKLNAMNPKYNMKRDDKRDAIKYSHPQKRLNRKDSSYDITKRNKRDVWTVNTRPYTEAHFAVFPPALIQPCILAGSREGDIILDPFFGSGTVAEVAALFNRNWIGIDVNKEYAPLYKKRLGLFAS